MADYGHKETDKRLAVMEKRIAKVYADTLAEAKDKLSAVLEEFRELDEKKAQAVADGKLSKKAYTAWRQELLGKEKHLRDMIDVLTEDFTNADKIAMKIVNGEAKDIYALNANFAAYDIEKKANVNLSWTLYDHSTVERLIREEPNLLPLPSVDVPVDKRWNQKHITAAINRGILLGDPIQDIAKRLVTVASMDLNAAVRSARTATTAAECAGRIDTYKYAQSIGIEMEQEWLATLDGRTRHEHRLLDGQRVAVGEAFHVGGASIRYPGDPQAPGYLIYNCRCTLVSAVKGIDQSDAPRVSKLGGMSYEDWKSEKKSPLSDHWQTVFADLPKQKRIFSFNSVKDAEKWIYESGVKFVSLDGADKDTAATIANAVSTLPNGVRPKSVTDLTSFKKGFGGKLGRKDNQIYGVTLNNIWGINFGDGNRDFDGGVMIGYNFKNFKTAEAIRASKEITNKRYFEKTGRNWHFNMSGEATYYHEIGHAYAELKGIPNDFHYAVQKWYKETPCDILQKDSEAWAEAWAAYYTGNTELPDYIAEFIRVVK